MMELKTLKDLKKKLKKAKFSYPTPTERERQFYIRLQEIALDLLKAEAVKWVKEYRSWDKNLNGNIGDDIAIQFMLFFNLTEEDLK